MDHIVFKKNFETETSPFLIFGLKKNEDNY